MAGLGVDNVSVFFLAEGEQPADEVMARLTSFIRAAKQTLDFAIFDMRFSDPLKASLSSALRERAEAGVKIRFCYDLDHFCTILAICWRKSFAPPEAGWRTWCISAFNSFSCEAATLPSATISLHGKRSRKPLSADRPADRSLFVGMRLLNMPRRGSNECHGNAFHSTNSSGFRPSLSNELQTIVAVGSEKPSVHCSRLLVRLALKLEKTCSGFIPAFSFFPSRIRSDVMGIPVKCPPL